MLLSLSLSARTSTLFHSQIFKGKRQQKKFAMSLRRRGWLVDGCPSRGWQRPLASGLRPASLRSAPARAPPRLPRRQPSTSQEVTMDASAINDAEARELLGPGRFTRVFVENEAGQLEARLSQFGNWELRIRSAGDARLASCLSGRSGQRCPLARSRPDRHRGSARARAAPHRPRRPRPSPSQASPSTARPRASRFSPASPLSPTACSPSPSSRRGRMGRRRSDPPRHS